jgi:hypothetical protein
METLGDNSSGRDVGAASRTEGVAKVAWIDLSFLELWLGWRVTG